MQMEKLAIQGGNKAVQSSQNRIKEQTRWPQMGKDELNSINTLFEDANITTHPVIRDLEKRLQRKNRIKICIGT